jgi:16S rRNA (guanine1207-N2)-methyltransferase
LVLSQTLGKFKECIVNIPRSKDLARKVVVSAWEALRENGTLFIRVANDLGAKGWGAQMRKRFGDDFISTPKSHARFFAVKKRSQENPFIDWRELSVVKTVETFRGVSWKSLPGDFSWKGIDPGSQILLDELLGTDRHASMLRGRGLDLCAGNGVLGIVLLRECSAVTHMTALEHYYPSILLSRAHADENLQDPSELETAWSDARKYSTQQAFDFIVSNPPHHQGSKTDPVFGAQILQAGIQCLKPGGQLILVANSQLPYEKLLANRPEVIARGTLFKVLGFSRELLQAVGESTQSFSK